jgi:hypothetical protein
MYVEIICWHWKDRFSKILFWKAEYISAEQNLKMVKVIFFILQMER